jgi:Na+/glutamate symporter
MSSKTLTTRKNTPTPGAKRKFPQLHRGLIPAAVIGGSLLTMISNLFDHLIDVPDLTLHQYGFPFPWIFHQTIAFSGPVNVWTYNFGSLLVNTIFWWGLSFVAILIWQWYRSPINEQLPQTNL